MKISLAFVHKYLISYSASWTGFPGRLPRTMKKKPKVSELMELWLTTKQQKKACGTTITLMALRNSWHLRCAGLNQPTKETNAQRSTITCNTSKIVIKTQDPNALSIGGIEERPSNWISKKKKKKNLFFLWLMPAHLPRVGQ